MIICSCNNISDRRWDPAAAQVCKENPQLLEKAASPDPETAYAGGIQLGKKIHEKLNFKPRCGQCLTDAGVRKSTVTFVEAHQALCASGSPSRGIIQSLLEKIGFRR